MQAGHGHQASPVPRDATPAPHATCRGVPSHRKRDAPRACGRRRLLSAPPRVCTLGRDATHASHRCGTARPTERVIKTHFKMHRVPCSCARWIHEGVGWRLRSELVCRQGTAGAGAHRCASPPAYNNKGPRLCAPRIFGPGSPRFIRGPRASCPGCGAGSAIGGALPVARKTGSILKETDSVSYNNFEHCTMQSGNGERAITQQHVPTPTEARALIRTSEPPLSQRA